MAKAKATGRRRRGYEYDHEYGHRLSGTKTRTSGGKVKPSRAVTSATSKKAAKKR